MDYAKILNEKQLEAVTSTSKYLRIIAGAGSGKTRVLTFRISYLIEKFNVYPNQILAITFTNKAAEEIKNRVEKSLNQPNLNLKIFTFHSFCARILREDIRLINYPSSFNIIDDDDQKKILKNVFEKLSIDSKKITISSMLNYIANKKNSFTSPEAALNDSVNDYFLHQRAQIYDEYEKKLSVLPIEVSNEFEKAISLNVIDKYWTENINTLSHLREAVMMRGYGGQDPLRAYTMEGLELYENMLDRIDKDTTIFLKKAEIRQNIERKEVVKKQITNESDTSTSKQPKRNKEKVGRNDPCPCGSGKKYKQCCGK